MKMRIDYETAECAEFLPRMEGELGDERAYPLNFMDGGEYKRSAHYGYVNDLHLVSQGETYDSLLGFTLLAVAGNELVFANTMAGLTPEIARLSQASPVLRIFRARMKANYPSFVREHHLIVKLLAAGIPVIFSREIDHNGIDLFAVYSGRLIPIRSRIDTDESERRLDVKEKNRHPLPSGLLVMDVKDLPLNNDIGRFRFHPKESAEIVLEFGRRNFGDLRPVSGYPLNWRGVNWQGMITKATPRALLQILR